jgi:alcohol dehydrogenase
MSKSLAAVFAGSPYHLELKEFPIPEPQEAETLVRVLGCTLCGSDLHSYEGRREVPTPTILGHEIVGEVLAFGAGTKRRDLAHRELRPGDRVTWSIVANCGACFFCGRGLPQKCRSAVKYGHEVIRPGYELLGGLAQHCLLTAGTAVMRLPEELPLEVACPASCATATVAAAIDAAGDLRNRNVGILGAGLLGLTAATMSRRAGAADVVCADIHAGRRKKALEFGASRASSPEELADVVASATDGHGADVVFELSGAPGAFETVWPLMRLGGSLILVGAVLPAPPVRLDVEQVVRRHLVVRGIHNYAPHHLRTAVQFLAGAHREFPFADLVAKWYALTDAPAAFESARDRDNVRVGIQP